MLDLYLLYIYTVDMNIDKIANHMHKTVILRVKSMIDISGHLRTIRREIGFLDTTQELLINCCGYQKFITKDFSKHREHGRLDYQLIYITNGFGNFLIDNKIMKLGTGSIILFPPHIKQSYTYYASEQPEVYWVHFTGSKVDKLLEKMNLLSPSYFSIGLNDSCIRLFKKMIYELQLKRPQFEDLSTAYLLQLLAMVSRIKNETKIQKNNPKYEVLQKAVEHMHRYYYKKWSIREFAKLCNLSEYHFIHLFKEFTGLPPIQYLTSIRMDKAKELLLNSSLSIYEISYILGYNNPLYFSRLFKKVTGISPSSYRDEENHR